MKLALSVCFFICQLTVAAQSSNKFHATTSWKLKPSLKYDALCLLNTLTGDPYYVNYYPQEYAAWKDRITPEASAALDSLKIKVKDRTGNIISAYLCLYFSAVDDSTLQQLISTVQRPDLLKRKFGTSVYYSESGWRLFDSIRPELGTILKFLEVSGFEAYWTTTILPITQKKIREIESNLSDYNVIAEDERMLGVPLSGNEIIVNMLYFSKPHGIKVTGTEFLTDQAWPFRIVLRNAVHEMMHPPFDWNHQMLKHSLGSFKSDAFLMDKVLNHDRSFGYNSFEGFIEENCVQALEQLINEKFGVAVEARKRWKENDGGMHVFAVALYQVMKAENYNVRDERLSYFLIRMIEEGKLKPGSIEKMHKQFYESTSEH